MLRHARIVIPGLPHPITQRGNNRQDVFFMDGDRGPALASPADRPTEKTENRTTRSEIIGACPHYRPTAETGTFLTQPFEYPKHAQEWYIDVDASAGWIEIEARRNDAAIGKVRIEGKNGRIACSGDDAVPTPTLEPGETYQFHVTLHNAKLFSIGAGMAQ